MSEDFEVCIASSTRADWGLLLPLVEELEKRGANPVVLATHAHLLPELGMTVGEIESSGRMPVRIPASGMPAEATAAALRGFGQWFAQHKPRKVVVLGDRAEMLGVATAALLNGVEIHHIAGGTVSLGAYDNNIRNAISMMASRHYPETEACARRLERMGIEPGRITVSGALGVWNALQRPLMSLRELSSSLGFDLSGGYLVGTLHSATFELLRGQSAEGRLADFLEALQGVLERMKLILTYPNTDADPSAQIEMLRRFEARNEARVKVVDSLGMVRYLSAVKHSRGVIGNSSSGLVEVPSLGVGTLDIGERQRGREHGPSVIHCGSSRSEIARGLERLLDGEALIGHNPYEKEQTPSVIADGVMGAGK